ncbi:MAG TPA: YciI family protein [Miltoncostaea sp.]|nr:YciI family protein [Miltoncostaea sp.]
MATGPHLILFYDYVPDIVERRPPHREAHLARIGEEVDAGRIVMAGALGDPPTGAAIVFAGAAPDEVEAFADADPYVRNGLVTGRRIVPWTVVASA